MGQKLAQKGGLVLHNALGQLRAKNLGPGKYPDGQGLWLVKRSKGAGKWILRLSVYGKRREMGLGGWPDVSIAEARERAAEARRILRDGFDPIIEREKAKNKPHRLTLKEAIDGCFEARKAELKRDGEAGRWMSPLATHIIPKIGKLPVEDVDQHTLKRVLDPIWHEKTEAAAKSLQRLNLTLKHAAAMGLDVDMQAPMKARALLGKQRHRVQHIPSMPYSEVPEFYRWLSKQDGVAAIALRFLMLTLARTSEVRLATFAEMEGDVWTLPSERTKTAREHRIPLTPDALQIISQRHDAASNDYLFPAYKCRPLSDMAMSSLMKREGFDARPHGFRATFRTWCEEQTDAAFETKEAVLGHVVDAGVIGAYQRSDRLEKRRDLMLQWEALLTSQRVK